MNRLIVLTLIREQDPLKQGLKLYRIVRVKTVIE